MFRKKVLKWFLAIFILLSMTGARLAHDVPVDVGESGDCGVFIRVGVDPLVKGYQNGEKFFEQRMGGGERKQFNLKNEKGYKKGEVSHVTFEVIHTSHNQTDNYGLDVGPCEPPENTPTPTGTATSTPTGTLTPTPPCNSPCGTATSIVTNTPTPPSCEMGVNMVVSRCMLADGTFWPGNWHDFVIVYWDERAGWPWEEVLALAQTNPEPLTIIWPDHANEQNGDINFVVQYDPLDPQNPGYWAVFQVVEKHQTEEGVWIADKLSVINDSVGKPINWLQPRLMSAGSCYDPDSQWGQSKAWIGPQYCAVGTTPPQSTPPPAVITPNSPIPTVTPTETAVPVNGLIPEETGAKPSDQPVPMWPAVVVLVLLSILGSVVAFVRRAR